MSDTITATTRRWPLWTAAALAAAITVLHLLGTAEFVDPLLHADLDAAVGQLFRVLWHICTLLLASLAVALAWAARADRTAARPVLAYTWFIAAAFTCVFFAINVAAFGGAVFTLPQWTLFVPLLVLIPLPADTASVHRESEVPHPAGNRDVPRAQLRAWARDMRETGHGAPSTPWSVSLAPPGAVPVPPVSPGRSPCWVPPDPFPRWVPPDPFPLWAPPEPFSSWAPPSP
ncbi:hypothetical protein QMK19_22010 [Streptomyces sp. H10-C2]|uniref:hypothetical protein n=1 Tax=unclassified Streptomyces TaxID=2593676 RepID=UPI0024B99AD4|nr:MULTISPECIES: hypothetical protein [unclassified Streptomyces]MDJ0342410.1 hypothetical protein [Streptomyces sp. PH10-H1]MDJ0372265.1 hypothetical protein [Streptomyces sp. H10-C2]